MEDYKIANGTIVGFPGAEAWDSKKNGALIEIECDILGACAKEKVNYFITNRISIFSRSSLPITHTRSRPRSSQRAPMVQLLQLVTRSWLLTSAWSFQICI